MPRIARSVRIPIVLVASLAAGGITLAQDGASGALLPYVLQETPTYDNNGVAHALRDASLFAIAPPEIRTYKKHDLVHIIVREASSAQSSQDIETEKNFDLAGAIRAWPHLSLEDILNLQMYAGRSTNLPVVRVDIGREFDGEGDYNREDDFVARLTAEIVDILPNGNLILEARTHIVTDQEESTIKVTGVCRPDDVSPANTIFSSLLHDLQVEKTNSGYLRDANKKGILTRILETIFAF